MSERGEICEEVHSLRLAGRLERAKETCLSGGSKIKKGKSAAQKSKPLASRLFSHVILRNFESETSAGQKVI